MENFIEKSESIVNLSKSLSLFHTKVSTIKRDSLNPFFKKNYASLSNILNEIEMPLLESGLTFTQFPCGQNGLTTILLHSESGEYIMANYLMQPEKNTPQALGSSITYQRRYSLCAILGLNVEDDDAENTKKEVVSKPNTPTEPKNEIKTVWLTQEQFDKAILSDAKGINAVLTKYSTKEFAMKKEFKTQLENALLKLVTDK